MKATIHSPDSFHLTLMLMLMVSTVTSVLLTSFHFYAGKEGSLIG